MKTINEHIKHQNFKNVYLLYGSEAYLKRQYRDKLKNALIGDDTMNYNHYAGKGLDIHEIISISETMPFFAERRLLVIEDSGFFTSSNDEFADYIKNIPSSTYIVFVEESVDKKYRLYKAVASIGYTTELSAPKEEEIKKWLQNKIKEADKKITEQDFIFFLSTVNNDMENISQEFEKLLCYTADREVITKEDIEEICSVHIESKIFDMLKAVTMKKQREALRLYDDLLALKEPPLKILALLVRQFNILLQIKELLNSGYNSTVIAQRIGIKEFIVRQNIPIANKYTLKMLYKILKECIQSEEAIKTGLINEKIAVEILIIKYSTP